MLLLVLIVWWTFPFVLVGGLVLARCWYERKARRRFEEDVEINSGRLREMHERYAVSVLRPNGTVENVTPVSRRRDGEAA